MNRSAMREEAFKMIYSMQIQKVENKIGFLFKNSQLQALDITIPVISNINKEYRDI